MLPVRWLPPEAFVDGKFTTYSDVYSYGVLLWEVFTFAMLPYDDYDNNKTMELILEVRLLGDDIDLTEQVGPSRRKFSHSRRLILSAAALCKIKTS